MEENAVTRKNKGKNIIKGFSLISLQSVHNFVIKAVFNKSRDRFWEGDLRIVKCDNEHFIFLILFHCLFLHRHSVSRAAHPLPYSVHPIDSNAFFAALSSARDGFGLQQAG